MGFTKLNGLAKVAMLSALMVLANSASAALVSGDITFSGNWDSDRPLSSTIELMFPSDANNVDGTAGDFDAVGADPAITINTLNFGPGGLDGSVFASIGGFDFTLDSIDVVLQTGSILLLEGTGVVSGDGIMDTAVTFTFSANSIGGLQNYSAGFTAAPVPVPGALLLLGSALAGLGMRRR